MCIKQSIFSDSHLYTWYYNTNMTWGRVINNYYSIHALITSLVITVLNLASVFLLHHNLAKISVSGYTSSNRRREKKLLVQCILTGTFYTFTCLIYGGILYQTHWGQSIGFDFYVVFHLTWVLNHIISGVIYFVYNKDLVEVVAKFLGCCKIDANAPTHVFVMNQLVVAQIE